MMLSSRQESIVNIDGIRNSLGNVFGPSVGYAFNSGRMTRNISNVVSEGGDLRQTA